MLKIFRGFLLFTTIGLERCQMETCTNMVLVKQETLLEMGDALFRIFLFLIYDSQVVISVDTWTWELQSLFNAGNRLFGLSFTVQNATHADQAFGVFTIQS
jgi:hypothetical protein